MYMHVTLMAQLLVLYISIELLGQTKKYVCFQLHAFYNWGR